MAKTWRDAAIREINISASLYEGDDLDELEKLIRSRYPFGARKHHPYKVWLQAVNDYMRERRLAAGVDAATDILKKRRDRTNDLPLFSQKQKGES